MFRSLTADQIDLSRTGVRGVKDFKAFLDFADRGAIALAAQDSGSLGGVDSPASKQPRQTLTTLKHSLRAKSRQHPLRCLQKKSRRRKTQLGLWTASRHWPFNCRKPATTCEPSSVVASALEQGSKEVQQSHPHKFWCRLLHCKPTPRDRTSLR